MRVATVAGIPIRLHWSFLLLIGGYLVVTAVTSGIAWAGWALALSAAVFASVVLHELGHALAALWFGVRTAHITLYPFGGIAALTEPPRNAREELVVALAGPAVNGVLAASALSVWGWFGGTALLAFAGMNLVMGLFNLLPAFPMDGGRVLRALLSWHMGYWRASEVSIGVGRVFAWGFLGLGLVAWVPSLLLVGGFLLFALAGESRRLALQARWYRPRRRPLWSTVTPVAAPPGGWPHPSMPPRL